VQKEQVRFRVYTVNQCGYYKRGESTPEFGDLVDTLNHLREWVKGKNLKDTATYKERDEFRILPAYCHKILSNDFGEYLLTTWNKVPSNKDTIASIQGDEPANEATINTQKFPHKSIPGYPTYFWILPEKNRIITISIDGMLNGMEQLKKYFSNFLAVHAPFAIKESEDHEDLQAEEVDLRVKIIGYTPDINLFPPQRLSPRFETFLFDRGSQSAQYVRERLELVRRIATKRELRFDNDEERDIVNNMLSMLKYKGKRKPSKITRLRTEIDFASPTEEEFNEILRGWREHINSTDSEWDDLGFRLETSKDQIIWLDKFYVSRTFSIDIKKEDGIISSEHLLKEISARRAEFLQDLML
jgi:hypothetical protein